ncbi:MAG: hypothetical protein U0822_17585 [Anaerolineae bacterium]
MLTQKTAPPRLEERNTTQLRLDLKRLTQREEGWHVSLFIPTYSSGAATEQNPIRYRNLLTQANERLVAAGVRAPDAAAFLAPAQRLASDSHFWQKQRDGLAVFLSPAVGYIYRVGLTLPERVVVGPRFALRPLLPLLTDDPQFYVLALSLNQTRLYRGDREALAEVELTDTPTSLDDALRYSELGKERLSFSVASPGRSDTVSYGRGIKSDILKDEVLAFFQQLNKGVVAAIEDSRAPLLLAGVDYLFPIYREANSYANLSDDAIPGNPDRATPADLHARAWPLVASLSARGRAADVARFQALAGTGRTAIAVEEIVPAAENGRVETLFVSRDAMQPGVVDPATGAVTPHATAAEGDEDLMDVAALAAHLNGAAVYVVPAEEMPDKAPLAAILRY